MWLDGLYMASPFMARYGAEFNHPEWIDEAVKQFTLCHQHTYDAKTGLYIMHGMRIGVSDGLIRKPVIPQISGDVVSVGGLWLW